MKQLISNNFEISDIDFNNNSTLEQDLNNNKNGFLDIILTSISKEVNKFVDINKNFENKTNANFIKTICNQNLSKKYYNIFLPSSFKQLKTLIFQIFKLFEQENNNSLINLNWINTSQITNFNEILLDKDAPLGLGLFPHLQHNIDISAWDLSSATSLSYMFWQATGNIGDLSKWDVSNVRDMSYLFCGSLFNGDISMWDVSNVCDMRNMFYDTIFNGDLSMWDVSHVENMEMMFANSQFNRDISAWDVSNVNIMNGMFVSCKFNQPIGNWDVSNVESFIGMFKFNKNFNQDISKWKINILDPHKVSNMMFNCKLKDEYIPYCLRKN